jgi:hypothetical protein
MPTTEQNARSASGATDILKNKPANDYRQYCKNELHKGQMKAGKD